MNPNEHAINEALDTLRSAFYPTGSIEEWDHYETRIRDILDIDDPEAE